MTMSDKLQGIVVAHGKVASALIEAAEQITGNRDSLVPVSNTGCDRGELEARVEEAVAGRRSVVFVDLAAGSCLVAVLHRLRENPDVRVVTGVNLAMLVDFLFHLELTPEEAAARAETSGLRAIRRP